MVGSSQVRLLANPPVVDSSCARAIRLRRQLPISPLTLASLTDRRNDIRGAGIGLTDEIRTPVPYYKLTATLGNSRIC